MDTVWQTIIHLSGRSRALFSLLPTAALLALAGGLYVDGFVGWQPLLAWWQSLVLATQIVLASLALLAVFVFAAPFEALTPTFLRWAGGHWPDVWPLSWLYEKQCARHKHLVESSLEQFGEMAPRRLQGQLTPSEERYYQQLEALLHDYPPDPRRALPTLLGNAIRAAEDYARERYGLDPNVSWIRLYPVIDIVMRDAVEETRTVLDFLIRLIAQLICFAVIAFLLEWRLGRWEVGTAITVVTMIIALLTHRTAIQVGKQYGELVRAVFDLYRPHLYRLLRLPLPSSSGVEERLLGNILTQHLWRGDISVHYAPLMDDLRQTTCLFRESD